MTSGPSGNLIRELRGVGGLRIEADVPLSGYSTFRIGGPVDFVALVETRAALVALFAATERLSMPCRILGLGSNVLFPDEGLPGAVTRLTGEFMECRFAGTEVTVGGGMALGKLARLAAEQGLQGLEALAGFPSTVGGAVRMNAGSYGVEIKDVLIEATVVDRRGRARRLTVADLEPGYRSTSLQQTRSVVVDAKLQLRRGSRQEAFEKMDELKRRRWKSLPSGRPNVGSIFRNPAGDYAGRLIEACGLKGSACGGAQISPEHANVIVNNGGAKAAEVLQLMLASRRAVRDRFGVDLEPEVELVGSLRERWQEALDR